LVPARPGAETSQLKGYSRAETKNRETRDTARPAKRKTTEKAPNSALVRVFCHRIISLASVKNVGTGTVRTVVETSQLRVIRERWRKQVSPRRGIYSRGETKNIVAVVQVLVGFVNVLRVAPN
jgi:hypothetical protein